MTYPTIVIKRPFCFWILWRKTLRRIKKCVEVWWNTYKEAKIQLFLLQSLLNYNQVVILKLTYQKYPANDIQNVNLTAIQMLFKERESQYYLRGTYLFHTQEIKTNLQSQFLSGGCNYWRTITDKYKTIQCKNLNIIL